MSRPQGQQFKLFEGDSRGVSRENIEGLNVSAKLMRSLAEHYLRAAEALEHAARVGGDGPSTSSTRSIGAATVDDVVSLFVQENCLPVHRLSGRCLFSKIYDAFAAWLGARPEGVFISKRAFLKSLELNFQKTMEGGSVYIRGLALKR